MWQFAHNVTYNELNGVALDPVKVRPKARPARTPPRHAEEFEKSSGKPAEFPSISLKTTQSIDKSSDGHASLESYVPKATSWLRQCLEQHDSCKKTPRFSRILGGGSTHVVIDLDNESAMPTRLLKLNEDTIQLVEVQQGVGAVDYVALSHRWGPNETFKTTEANISEMKKGMQTSTLPRTFRDSANFTKALGYSYLWIDSLCIIQNNAEDWKSEAPRMACIYGNSVLTISALDASDSEGGLLMPEAEHREGLNLRAWALQERMIPPRSLLFFSNTMSWECRQSDANPDNKTLALRSHSQSTASTHPKELYAFLRDWEPPGIEMSYNSDKSIVLLQDIEELTQNEDHVPFLQTWWKFISYFSTCQLTRSSDKFMAICGITNTVLRNVHLKNHFGLWGGNNLLYELSWYIDRNGPEGVKDQKSCSLAPSWAWPSVNNGRVCNDYHFRAPSLLQLKPWMVLPFSTSFEHELPYRPWVTLSALSIDLKGHLRELTVTKVRKQDTDEIKYDVSIDQRGRLSDHEVHDFRPDCADDFPLNQPVRLTCIHFYHYDKDYTKYDTHIDVFLVLNKMHVLEDEQGNLHEDGKYVGFTFDTPRWGNRGYQRVAPGQWDPSKVEDEQIANKRTFQRVGYMETTYTDIRTDMAAVHEERWWRFTRIL